MQHRDGTFQAQFNSKDKVKIQGQGQDLDLNLNSDGGIDVDLSQADLQTQIHAKQNEISAHTQGQGAHLKVQGSSIDVHTEGSHSEITAQIGKRVSAQSQSGDVSVSIHPQEAAQGAPTTDETIQIRAQNTRTTAKVGNRQGNLQL